MKRILILLAAMAVALAPHGSAHAYPIKDKTLTANKLYRTGALNSTRCVEKRVRPRDARLAKAYLHGILNCLNTTWAAQLRKSGQTFRKPVLKVTTKAPRRFCAQKWGPRTDAYYCDDTRTLLIVLRKEFLADPSDLFLFNLISAYYGQHVQNLTGIWDAHNDQDARTKKEENEQIRRYELQNLCFGTAFLKSTWRSLDRSTADWRKLMGFVQEWNGPKGGNKTNIAYWANRGFASGNPGACNTWTAPSKRVA